MTHIVQMKCDIYVLKKKSLPKMIGSKNDKTYLVCFFLFETIAVATHNVIANAKGAAFLLVPVFAIGVSCVVTCLFGVSGVCDTVTPPPYSFF